MTIARLFLCASSKARVFMMLSFVGSFISSSAFPDILQIAFFLEPLVSFVQNEGAVPYFGKLTQLVLANIEIDSGLFNREVCFLPDGYFFHRIISRDGGRIVFRRNDTDYGSNQSSSESSGSISVSTSGATSSTPFLL